MILLAATLTALIYTAFKNRPMMCRGMNLMLCLLIGLALGKLGSFLGIGGPLNMAVLYYFFHTYKDCRAE